MAAHSPNTEHEAELPAGVIEDLLDDEARRRMLVHLYEADEPVAVDDLAALVATGSPSGSIRTEQRRRVRTDIYQAHLPKLTATGTVSFDSMLGTVEFTGGPALRARLDAEGDGSEQA